jgi:hypothetical protein
MYRMVLLRVDHPYDERAVPEWTAYWREADPPAIGTGARLPTQGSEQPSHRPIRRDMSTVHVGGSVDVEMPQKRAAEQLAERHRSADMALSPRRDGPTYWRR